MQLLIGGVDKTGLYVPKTLNITDNLNARTTCSFSLVDKTGNYHPEVGEEVLIYDQGTLIFGGTIDEPEEENPLGTDALIIPVQTVDWHEKADRLIVAEEYNEEHAGDIVRDIIAKKLAAEGITEGVIQDGPVISKAIFPYIPASQCFDELCELTGYQWVIKPDKALDFFERSTNSAPWGIADNSPVMNIRVRRNREQFRNRQYLRAGKDISTVQTREFIGDGKRQVFSVDLPIAKVPVVKVNGVAQTVGIRGLDKETAPIEPVTHTDTTKTDFEAGELDGVVATDDGIELAASGVSLLDNWQLETGNGLASGWTQYMSGGTLNIVPAFIGNGQRMFLPSSYSGAFGFYQRSVSVTQGQKYYLAFYVNGDNPNYAYLMNTGGNQSITSLIQYKDVGGGWRRGYAEITIASTGTAGPMFAYDNRSISRDREGIFDEVYFSTVPPVFEGTFTSSPIDISTEEIVETTEISWISTEPEDTSITIETALSLDGGETWSEWQTATSGSAIPGITEETDLSNARLKYRATLETQDTSVTPILHSVTVSVYPRFIGWYWQKGDKEISQNTMSEPLSSADTLTIEYQGYYPIMVLAEDGASINERKAIEGGTGVYEHVEERRQIDTQAAALESAQGLLRRYARINKVMTFNTYKPGLRPGQLIHVNLPIHNINESLLISRITITDPGREDGRLLYSVECLSGEAVGGWVQFFKKLVDQGKTFVIRENEILISLLTYRDSFIVPAMEDEMAYVLHQYPICGQMVCGAGVNII